MNLHFPENPFSARLINISIPSQVLSGMVGVGIGLFLGTYFGLI